jgi:hypothetical protein
MPGASIRPQWLATHLACFKGEGGGRARVENRTKSGRAYARLVARQMTENSNTATEVAGPDLVMGFYTRLPMYWQPTNDPGNTRRESMRMVSKLDGKPDRMMLKVAGALGWGSEYSL